MLKPGDVRVWRARLDELSADALPPLLPEEAERAGRFRSDEVRQRFVRSHGVLRALLTSLGLPSQFDRDERGKPRFLEMPHVHFSLSRSHGMALYAFAMDVAVGVDIERMRPLPECLAIAERFFPPTHYAALLDTPPEAREAEFFRAWTRIEAALKALGVGLYGAGQELSGAWTMQEIEAPPGFAAAVAVPTLECRMVVSDFA